MKTRAIRFSTMTMTMLALLLLTSCFPSIALADEAGEHGSKSDISLVSFIRPLGICSLGFALVTFTTGLFRRKLGKRFLKVHRAFAWLTVGFALCHGILVSALF